MKPHLTLTWGLIRIGAAFKPCVHVMILGQRDTQRSGVRKNYTKAAASNPDSSNSRPKGPASLPSLNKYLPVGSERIVSKLRGKYNGDTSDFKILSCTWWHRAWTLQELVLSESTVLLRGRYEIDWPQLCAGAEYGLQLLIWPIMDSGFVLNQALIPTPPPGFSKSGSECAEAYPEEFGITPAEDLLSLLLHCQHREARDPGDKIYAVLGVFTDIHSSEADNQHSPKVAAQPDYGHPVAYVYMQISQQVIKHTRTLDILGLCPKSTRSGLPSCSCHRARQGESKVSGRCSHHGAQRGRGITCRRGGRCLPPHRLGLESDRVAADCRRLGDREGCV